MAICRRVCHRFCPLHAASHLMRLLAVAGGDLPADSRRGEEYHTSHRLYKRCGRCCLHPGSPQAHHALFHRHEQLHDVRPLLDAVSCMLAQTRMAAQHRELNLLGLYWGRRHRQLILCLPPAEMCVSRGESCLTGQLHPHASLTHSCKHLVQRVGADS